MLNRFKPFLFQPDAEADPGFRRQIEETARRGLRGPSEALGTLEWSDEVFAASGHLDTRLFKYKTVTHGTKIFEHHPVTEQMVVDWFVKTISITQ